MPKHADAASLEDRCRQALSGLGLRFDNSDLETAFSRAKLSLLECEGLLRAQLLFLGRRSIVSRPAFFSGRHFSVHPSPEELALGVLIPGHRFLPYCDRGLNPSILRLTNKAGRPLAVRRVEVSLDLCAACHCLLAPFEEAIIVGGDNYPAYLKALTRSARGPAPSLSVWAFDMAATYKALSLGPDDSLILKSEDWFLGRFSLQGAFKSAEDPQAGQRDLETIERGFDSATTFLPRRSDYADQAAYAVYLERESLGAKPAASVEDFARGSQRYFLERSASYSSLRPRAEIPDPGEWPAEGDDPFFVEPRQGDLDSYLRRLGLGLLERDIIAMVKTFIRRDGLSLDGVLKKLHRVFPANMIGEDGFFPALDASLRDSYTGFRRAQDISSHAASLRDSLVDILYDFRIWINRLIQSDLSESVINGREFASLAELMGMLTMQLRQLEDRGMGLAERRALMAGLPELNHRAEAGMRMVMELAKPRRGPSQKPGRRPKRP